MLLFCVSQPIAASEEPRDHFRQHFPVVFSIFCLRQNMLMIWGCPSVLPKLIIFSRFSASNVSSSGGINSTISGYGTETLSPLMYVRCCLTHALFHGHISNLGSLRLWLRDTSKETATTPLKFTRC